MPCIRTISQAVLLLGGLSRTLAMPHYPRTDGVSWGACEIDLPSVQCANFTVPLDYTKPNSRATLDLQLLRVPAVKQPKKGTILFNFGGPGLEARLTLAGTAQTLLAITGGEYDLVANDPRGTANTLTASCFNTTAERATFVGEPSSVIPSRDDELALGRVWGQTQVVEDQCFNFPGFRQRGSLIGTAFAARDLLQIVDAIEDDGLLRYYGTSYGTVLGATFAAMFPDRVDRLILDGVLNPHEYFNGYDVEAWADSDRTFSGFVEECLKAPDLCALGSRRVYPEDLEKDVYNLLEDLREEPLSQGDLLIDSSLVQTFIRFSLYSPQFYPALATALEGLLSQDAAAFADVYDAFVESGLDLTQSPDESSFAILCGDKRVPEQSLEEMAPVFEALEDESRLLGSSGHIQAMICQHWRIEANARYEGNFTAATRHPLLVIGNTFDPATPLRSAQNISAGFEGSVVLEHGGFGHTTLSQGSSCTINAIRSYFQDGTLPEPDTVCEADYAPFEPKTLTDVLVDLGYIEAAPEE
ncbi:alpha/beta hydrolase [Aspergillus lucknowensis]|uniref:TAP-like protein-domain-containing protein n=1 Tax=Aspergillus lucknowensis TaxID=176173 RepID=A0ABR4LXJ0_9EURO